MTQSETTIAATATSPVEEFDVVIVGAGISGIGAAHHLQEQCPGRSFVVLEALESFGGTWLTHKYPGVRSDSDLYTFGYRFKPWTGVPIASADAIRDYLGEVIEESDLAGHLRYGHRIVGAEWSSDTDTWTLEVELVETGERRWFRTNFMWMCQGYYRHSSGYTPEWPGMDRYTGTVVHPQTWPDDLDYAGKRIVVIGSGATAATLVPAIAEAAEHVTMLQRSPTYFYSAENRNELADQLRALDIPAEWIHEIVRRQNLANLRLLTQMSFEHGELVRDELINGVRAQLGPDYDIDRHFTPRYLPWRQRMAVVPDGDLFKGIVAGKASVVTDEIETFTERGLRLTSGAELEADIIVTATGFDLSVLGDIAFTIDGRPLDLAQTVTYRGMMFTGVPNLLWVFGYFRASWTLRADLIGDFTCRLLHHLDELGARRVTPELRPQDETLPKQAWIDPASFNPGYLMRALSIMPKRLDIPEWQHTQDYWLEREQLPGADLDDGCLRYS